MANLTVTVDDDLLRRARVRAVGQGTSVNALVRDYLEAYADPDVALRARRSLVELSVSVGTGVGSGSSGREWTRDQAHDR